MRNHSVKLYGEVAEWFKATVLKTVGGKTSVGSNPTLVAMCFLHGAQTLPCGCSIRYFPFRWEAVIRLPFNAARFFRTVASPYKCRANKVCFGTVCDRRGRKTRKKSSIFNALRGTTLKKNLCLNNAEKRCDLDNGLIASFTHQKSKEEGFMYQFKWVREHIEVLLNGVFQFSADNMSEALRELEED